MVKTLLILSYLIKYVFNCEYKISEYEVGFTEPYIPTIIVEKQLSSTVINQQENIGYGFWMRYQPYQEKGNLNQRKYLETIDDDRQPILQVGQFVYSVTTKNSKQKLLIVSQELNQNDQSIVHKAFINFKNGKQTITFQFDMTEYEGRWLLFYYFCNQLEGKTTFGFYQSSLNSIASQVINDLPQFEDIMIHQSGGLQYYENENQQLIMLNQFKGSVSCILSNENVDFETSIIQCSAQTSPDQNCLLEQFDFSIMNQDSQGQQYQMYYTSQQLNSKYHLEGWIKLDQHYGIELVTQLIRITINNDYNDDQILGDRDLLIKYYQNSDSKLNGFEVSTYSYIFPLKEKYSTPEELKIKVFGSEYKQAITQWHFIQYEIGTLDRNSQPLFQVYFSTFDEIKQYQFPVQVQHFTETKFLILFGGDEYTHKQIKGQTSDLMIYFICVQSSQELMRKCHYSCEECFGPTKYHCLSCSTDSFREFFVIENTCICQSNYIDVENEQTCQLADETFPQMEIEEISLDCDIEGYDLCQENQIQCSFGYFLFKNSCIKCPYYEDIYQKTKITCLDCFINPESFGQTLVCTKEAQTFYQNQENSYQIININESEQQQFIIEKTEMGENSLQICDGCTKTACKSGYFQRNKKCFKCIENCKSCENEYKCKECKEKYYQTFEETCLKCSNCNQCKFSEEQQRVVCLNCLNGKEGFPNYNCEKDYGSFCEDFDQSLYCNYCVENPKKYYLTFDGKNCSQCNIDNCQYCFQYIRIENYYITTIDIQFRIYKNFKKDVKLGCALCEMNYYFNFNTNQCEIKPQDNDCVFAIIEQNNNLKCIIGSTENQAVQVSDCSELKFCEQCIKNYFQSLPFCILCIEGYYAGLLSGQCLPCPKECKSCVQQNIRYKDQWKWDIKAFYKYFVDSNGDHSFEKYATLQDQQNMEIICTSCPEKYIIHNQKCILNCAQSCERCEIISNKAICTKCPIYKDVQLKSQDEQGSCKICPNYCSACLERTQEELKTINPYFVLSSSNLESTKICFEKSTSSDNPNKYFIDTKQLSVNHCENYKKCEKKVTITNLVYCVVGKKILEPSLLEREVSISQLFTDKHREYLESQEVNDFLLKIQPSQLIYQFQFKPDFYQPLCFSEFNIPPINVQAMQKIFSIKQTDIKFNGLEEKIKFKIPQKLSISNFTNIIFQKFEFEINYDSELQSAEALIQFNNLNYNSILTIKNCVVTTNNIQKKFPALFGSSHSYSAIIEDVLIKDLNITQSKLFKFNNLFQQNKGKIVIRNLKIIDSDFEQTSLFELNSSTDNFSNELFVENIFISNCQFRNSFFLQSKSIQNFNCGDIEIQNIKIENSIFQNSSFINIENARQLTTNELQVNNLTLNQNSQFYLVNVITIMSSYFDQVKLHNNSRLITNQINLDLNLEEQLNTYITNLEITNTEYDSIQSMISIQQQKKLEFLNFKLTNNYMIGSVNYNQISFSESQIYISCLVCILQNIDVTRLHGLPEISIMQTENISLTNIKLKQSNEFHPYLLHSDYNCLLELQHFEMSFFIYFGKYQKISLNNIQISETFTFNSPFLIFQGYDLLEKVQDEYIIIVDSKFEKNQLLIYREFASSSILYFDSNQNSVIEIENVQFLNNHLNEYYQNLKITSATTLVVLQRSGTFNMKCCSFIENIVTNSSDSILHVQSDSAKIENVTFLKNNLIEYLDFSQNLLMPNTQQEILFFDDLEKIFPVQSESGNGVFNVNNFTAQNVLINQSYAYSAGGLRLILKGQSFLVVTNSQFYNTRTALLSTIYSRGGCLYLDAQSTSSLIFNLSNIRFDTSYSRTEGGGIYISPSNTQNSINLQNLTIKDCFAIKNSFISFQLGKINQIVPSFQIENSNFFQDESNFKHFLKTLDDLTTFEAQTILLENPLIYTLYGNIIIENCSFVQTYSQFLIHIEEADNIVLKGLRLIKSTIKQSPLIRLSLRQSQKGFILIQDVEFLQNAQIESLNNTQCITLQSSIRLAQIKCPNNLFQAKQKHFNYKDNQKYLENQLQCNLKLLNNNTDFQVSLMEVINVENLHFLKIQGLNFEDNKCERCYYGLLKVAKINIEMKELLQINHLKVTNNVCGYSGCFSFLGKSSSSPFRSDLVSNRILLHSDLKNYKEKIRYDILIENSKFINNTAEFGGAVMIVEAQILILDCEFQFNKAKIGGAIYFFADSSLLILIQSKVIDNTAQIAGGIFLNNQSLQELHKLSVELSENNSTKYGSDVIESPRSLSLIVNENQIQLEKTNVQQSQLNIIEQIIVRPYKTIGQQKKLQFLTLPSGRPIGSYQYFDSQLLSVIPYNLTFRIIPLNKFNKQIKDLDNHLCKITPVSINSISNENVTDKFYALSYYSTYFNKETQDFNFDDLIIYFNPNYEDNLVLRLIIECDFIQIPVYDKEPPFLIIDYIKNYQLWVDIKTFKCQLGEYLNVTSGGCVLCDSFQNQYQVSQSAQNCSYKDDLKMKSIESSTIELRPNYWRAYYYSSTIEYCYHLEENCQGGWIPGDDSCIYGHIGALCEQCDLYNSRGGGSFSVSSAYSCGSCDKIAINVTLIILISFWTLISTLMSVSSTVSMIEEFIIELKLQQYRIIIGVQTASTAILIKIVTNYLQIISTISTFQLQIPVGLQTTFNSVGNPIEQMAYSLDCFLVTISNIDILYFRIIWSVLMAIFYILIFIFIGLLGKLINKIKFSISHVSTALLYIFIFMQPNLIQGLISQLSYRVISDENWVQGNVAYRYDTIQHVKWSIGFSLPLLILFGCFLPFLFWNGLYQNRNDLDKIIVRKIWGYLYNEYKQQSYYWEIIKIVQKELIIIVLVYYDDFIPIKASLIFLILFAYSYWTQQSKPYTTGELNHLDSQSTIVCAVSIILGSSVFSAQQNNLEEIVWPFYVIIILLNLLFISQMILKICFAYFKQLSEKIDKVKAFIQKRFSFALNFHPSLNKLFELNSIKQARIKQRYQKIREELMPQVRKWLIYKKNNFTVLDYGKKDVQMDFYDDQYINTNSSPKHHNRNLLDQLGSNRNTQNDLLKKIYPIYDSLEKDMQQQQ